MYSIKNGEIVNEAGNEPSPEEIVKALNETVRDPKDSKLRFHCVKLGLALNNAKQDGIYFKVTGGKKKPYSFDATVQL